MTKITAIKIIFLSVLFCLIAVQAETIDYPHNSANSITCESCHFVSGSDEVLLVLPEWVNHVPDTIDDTQFNTLCWSCHTEPLTGPLFMETHSSRVIDNGYGDWAVECRVCHNPHKQQFRSTNHGPEAYILEGTVAAVDAGTVTANGVSWDTDEYAGYIVVPNKDENKYNYQILSNDSDTLTVKGTIDLTRVSIDDNFGISYGKIVYDTIYLDKIIDETSGGAPVTRTGNMTVKFFNSEGDNSFADGDGVRDGICEACHQQTDHYQYDGDADDQLHDNVGGQAGANCIGCHPHDNGFAHGGSGGAGCVECHGHDAGTLYDPDMSLPFTVGTQASQGRGTVVGHSTHTESHIAGSSGDDDRKGPGIYCSTCHDTASFPNFIYSAPLDVNTDGKVDLSETDVCDTCHSDGGAYDGVNDPDFGAKYGNNGELKYNWRNSVYNNDIIMKTGMEKWCATCHDEVPSQIQGIDAPNVIGDEGATTNFGVGYGFYKTGHGLSANEYYPASGGTTAGAGVSCEYCHDLTMKHIDGTARTYVYTATEGNDDDYQHGYRLVSVGGLLPMDIPRVDGCESGVMEEDFRLCFRCHDSGPFTSASNYNTNFRHTGTPDYNAHYNHLAIQDECDSGPVYQSDWRSHSNDSRASCVACHNVHGSNQLSMVRDGSLIGRTGQGVLYYNSTVSYSCDNYPDPRNVPIHESTGTVYAQDTALCSTCHGSCGFDSVYLRTPFDDTPPRITKVQGQAGSDSLAVSFSESVYSDLNEIGFLLIGDFAFTDSDDSRVIDGITHVGGDDSAAVSLDFALDGTTDIGTDTLAAATATSIYDGNNNPMDTSPIIVSDATIATQTILHPSGLDSTTDCSPAGGAWADILDSNDGASTYADCYSYFDMSDVYTASFMVEMDDPSGLSGAVINHLTVRAVVDITGLTSATYGYMQVCYETGGAGQECGVRYELTGSEGYVDVLVGSNVDPDGNPFNLSDLNNLQVEVKLDAEDCCGSSDATAYVTEVYAEVDYIIPANDTDPPDLSNQDPANGTTGISIFSDLTFTITDSGNDINWNTFEIQLTGDQGYSELYTDADFVSIVTKTGYPSRYEVTVNPDTDFAEFEVITVSLRVDDFYGNTLVHPAWSFTTGTAPAAQTITLHPSGLVNADSFLTYGGGWADILDNDDGDSTLAYKCCDGFTKNFYVAMDDTGLGSATIQDLTIHVVARYVSNGGPHGRASQPGNIDIGYKTGTATNWSGSIALAVVGSNFDYVSSQTFTVDSDGGSLDLADIENLELTVRWETLANMLRVTEVYVEVTYFP